MQALRKPLVCAGAAWLLLVSKLVLHLQADPDLFARVAVGRIVASSGRVAYADPFSYTAGGAPWVDHEWLSGLIFYSLTQLGGDSALVTFKLAVLGGFLLLLAKASYVRNPRRALCGFACTTFFTYYIWYSTVRCQIFTYLFLAAYFHIFALSRERLSTFHSVTLIALMLAWSNLHGGFVLGIAFLGLFSAVRFIEERQEGMKLSCVLVACSSVTLINPYGWAYWSYIFHALLMKREFISEWGAVPLGSPVGILLTTLFLADTLPLLHRPKQHLLELSFLAASYAMGLSHLRLSAVLFIVSAVWGAPFAFLERLSLKRNIPSIVALGEVACYFAALFCGARAAKTLMQDTPFQLNYDAFPLGPANFLAQSGRRGNLLCGLNEGSFLLWRLYPSFRVSLDGRYEEVYDNRTVERVRCSLDPGCDAEMDNQADYVLLSSGALEQPSFLRRFGAAQTVYRDSRWAVIEIERHNSAPREQAQRTDPANKQSGRTKESGASIWTPSWAVTNEMVND
ncbi:MAG: hypothetical protein U0136_02035 [Bdellovibrionota bacterium]